VIGNQFAADWPLRVIAEGSARASPTTRALGAKGVWYEELQYTGEWITCRILPIACATALAAAFTLSLPHPAHADHVTPPSVPAEIQVPPGNEAFLVGHGVGTQNYVCLPSGTGVKFVLFTPQATLFNDDGKQLTTHFFSPNPL
jgi:hypothetical protein